MKKIRLGVVGCGVICQHHLAAAKESPLIEIKAVADLIPDRARSTAERFSVPLWLTSGEELIQQCKDVDAILLATATEGRTELVLKALKKGKHVLIEKPCGANPAEVESIIKAKGNLVAASCSSRFRFSKTCSLATEIISTGQIGRLREIYCRVHLAAAKKPDQYPPPWRLSKKLNGGGILFNWGCYDLDFLLGITNWSIKPKKVFAKAWNIPPIIAHHIVPISDAETHYSAFIACENDILLSIERSEYSPTTSEAKWHFIGDKGALEVQMNNCVTGGNKKTVWLYTLDSEKGTSRSIVWEGEESDNVHPYPILDFASAIINGHKPRTSIEDYLVIQKIFDGIYKSCETGNAVDIL